MGNDNTVSVETLVKVMRHPLRSRLLYAVADRPGTSAANVAAHLGEPIAKVRRHLRHLVEIDALVVCGREEKRGASQSFYAARRVPSLTHAEVEAGGERALDEITASILRAIVADLQSVAAMHGRSRVEDDCIGRLGGLVDEQGWKELAQIHEDTLMASLEARDRAQERLAAKGDEGIPFASTVLFFEVER